MESKKHIFISMLSTFAVLLIVVSILYRAGMNLEYEEIFSLLIFLPAYCVLMFVVYWLLGVAQTRRTKPSFYLGLVVSSSIAFLPSILGMAVAYAMGAAVREVYLGFLLLFVLLWFVVFFGSMVQYFLISRNA